jgi:hypothetical protein
MTEVNVETLYTFLIMFDSSDEDTRERIITRVCERTGLSKEKIEQVLSALRQMLTQDMPCN